SVQTARGGAVTSNGSISYTIVKVSEIANSIPSADEEQATATSEIANNVEQASSGTQSVTVSIADELTA
ncbi:MAG: methyl-accepting chemotaxis protein, partial [Rhodospirillales bacterium]